MMVRHLGGSSSGSGLTVDEEADVDVKTDTDSDVVTVVDGNVDDDREFSTSNGRGVEGFGADRLNATKMMKHKRTVRTDAAATAAITREICFSPLPCFFVIPMPILSELFTSPKARNKLSNYVRFIF